MKDILILTLILILGLLFCYVIFWHIPRGLYKNSKTKPRFFIKVFLYFTIPLILFYILITVPQGFIDSAKEVATKSNHAGIIKYIEAGINRCHNIAPQLNHAFKLSIDCSALNEVSSYQKVAIFFNDAGYKNPNQTNTPAVIYSSSEPALGMTSIFYKDSKVYIRTKVEDVDNLIFRDEKILERVIDVNL